MRWAETKWYLYLKTFEHTVIPTAEPLSQLYFLFLQSLLRKLIFVFKKGEKGILRGPECPKAYI
jgi:hypothetical protein